MNALIHFVLCIVFAYVAGGGMYIYVYILYVV